MVKQDATPYMTTPKRLRCSKQEPLFGGFSFGEWGQMDPHTRQTKTDFQATNLESKKDPLSDISELGGGPLKYRSGNAAKLWWERVNEVTWKLTDGEQTNAPRSHGQWGGYRTSKSVAWVIDSRAIRNIM
jgi:hypothetical protein